MAKIIGIDLGTTNSCVAVLEGGEPVVASPPFQGRYSASGTTSPVHYSRHGVRGITRRSEFADASV